MEFGHVNHARDFAHSHLEMLIPLDMVPTYEKELETHGELQVYFIDAAKEIKLRTEEHYLNTQQASTRMERERKLTFIAQSEDYFNFTGIVYPLDEVNALPSPLKDCVASEYVCVRITFIEASPETRIDFLLGPVLGIVKKK
jgi:hypothetical protein